jgi:hypothetical protein
LVILDLFPEEGMIKKLIRCSKCNQVFSNYEDSSAAKDQSLLGVEWSNSDLAKAKEFLRTHSGHPLEELFIESESLASEKPDYEPIRVTYILASNSHKREFLIRRTRTAFDQSASYEIIHGKLRIFNTALKIQEYELRKQINSEKEFSLLLKRKMEKFIEAFRDETAGISPEDFEREAESIEEGETSLTAYGGLKDIYWKRILGRCGGIFKESELNLVKKFIEENRVPPEVLSVQIQRRISVISSVEMEPAESAPKSDKTGMAVEDESHEFAERKTAKKRNK